MQNRYIYNYRNKVSIMEKKKKKIILFIVLAYITVSILGIGFLVFAFFIPEIFHMDRYKGKYPHLYTVAVYSLLTEGRISGAESYGAADVQKLDEDTYGRELFVYYGSPIVLNEDYQGACSVLICQKHDGAYAYWYDNENYILAPYYGYAEEKDNGVYEDRFKGITEEQIEELKEKNDWGKAIDESKLSSAKIVRDPLAHSGNKAKAEKFYNRLLTESGYEFRWCYSVARDKDGRAIYSINGIGTGEGFTTKHIIAILSPDGEFYEDGWFVFDSPKTYTENLTRAKQSAGWNMKV